ncbi:MAG TPA: NAD(P)/FAD-dependent oxidoreductase [Nocardioidaceae bacterium]|nr:NAD(P)/FAD-dependent oxidoreductase [Nocardioidaceae bacterium]
MNDYDVVVVGARVAGASTAMLLARAGLRVALLDRSAYGSDTVSTHALMRAGVLQLSRWGLLDRVIAAGTPPVRKVAFHYAGAETVHVSLRPSPGVDALYAPRRHLLDRILVDAAAEAGADVLHRTTVTGLLRDEHGRVAGVTTAGPPFQVRARFTVGADGIRSVVARETAAPVVHQGRAAGAVLYRYLSGLPDDGYVWAYGPGAAAGLAPTNDGQTCAFVTTTPERMRGLRARSAEAAFRTLLNVAAPEHAQRVAGAEPAGPFRGWAGVPGYLRRPWGPGWALVGDAGYFKDPITTHGITDALRDAELLADALVEVLTRITPAAVALARYQAARDRLSRDLRDATEAVAAYDWDTVQVQALLRRVSSAMSDELEHLQTRPDRGIAQGIDGFLRPDSLRARS